tara:strand:+ start:172 stop:522 length:351 start_codon:yes stop_codon:yes gene_type:complete
MNRLSLKIFGLLVALLLAVQVCQCSARDLIFWADTPSCCQESSAPLQPPVDESCCCDAELMIPPTLVDQTQVDITTQEDLAGSSRDATAESNRISIRNRLIAQQTPIRLLQCVWIL